MLYSILFIPSTEKKMTVPSSHTVLIQKSLRQSPVWCHSSPALLIRVSFMSVDKKVNMDFSSGWKKSVFSSFFLRLILYSLFCLLSCLSLFILIFVENRFSFSWNYPSLDRCNECSRLSWLFVVVNVVIQNSIGIIIINALNVLVVPGNQHALRVVRFYLETWREKKNLRF